MKITKTQLNQIIKEEIGSLQKEGLLGDLLKEKAKSYICGDLSERIQAAVNLKDHLPFEVPAFVEEMFDKFLGQAVCDLGTQLIEEAASSPEILELLKQLGGSGLFENIEGEKINVNNT